MQCRWVPVCVVKRHVGSGAAFPTGLRRTLGVQGDGGQGVSVVLGSSYAGIMHVYIDDSGDAGFNFAGGSSRFMIMAACLFFVPEDIEQAADCIRRCRDRNRQRREFKYSKTRDGIRDCFFECTERCRYAVRTIVVDKTKIQSSHLRSNPADFKSHVIYQLLTHHDGNIEDAKIVVDGQDSKPFGMSDLRYFRNNVNLKAPGTVRTVEFVDSKNSLPVQLADMTAGAVHRFVRDDAKRDERHFERFRRRTWRGSGGSLWRFS